MTCLGTRCGHCQVSFRVRFGSPTTSIHDCLEPPLTQRTRAGNNVIDLLVMEQYGASIVRVASS
eukprot:3282483-Prymnesium_polylepis.1